MTFLRIACLTFLLLQTAAQPLNFSLVYPDVRAPPIETKQDLQDELASWRTIQIFTTLLQAYPFLIPQNGSLMLAPTNYAFVKLLGRLAPQTGNPFSTAESIINTLNILITTGSLPSVLAYHIIPRDLMEPDLNGTYLTVSGAVLSFQDFPFIVDIDPETQPRRLYRQIKAADGSLMFLSEVLLPRPLKVIFPGAKPSTGVSDFDSGGNPGEGDDNEPFPSMRQNGSFPGVLPNGTIPYPNGSDAVGDSPYPPENEGPDFFSMLLGALSPLVSEDNFASNAMLIASRSDLQIMNALLSLIPGVNKTVTSAPGHILAPTDSAFIDLFLILGEKLDLPQLLLPDVSDPGFVSNLTEILQMTSAAESLWSSIAGLPGLAQIIEYHIIPQPADYASLMEMSRSAPIATGLQNSSLVFQNDSIIDADASRGDAMPIASFPTLNGFVTVVDRVLTPFDTSVAGAVLDGAMGSPTPTPTPTPTASPASGETAACFPADGVVYTRYGAAKIGDLKGGDEIVVDEAERLSAVFLFTHKQLSGRYEMVRLYTAAGYNVTLTSGHYVPSRGSLIAAGSMRVGDKLRTVRGESAVTKVERAWGTGLVAPHTVDGGLVVDGVVVSGYSRAVHPWIAHALLAPLRWYVKVSGAVEPLGGVFYGGGRGLQQMLPAGAFEYEWA